MAKKDNNPTLLSLYKGATKPSYEERMKPLGNALKNSSTYKTLIGVIIAITFLWTIQGFEIFYDNYGSVSERNYNEIVLTDNTIDYSSFEDYKTMKVPLVSFSKGLLPKMQSVDTLLSSMPTYHSFEIWANTNMSSYYKLSTGSFFERAIYTLTKPFVALYYNVVVRAMRLPQLIEAIYILFS